MADVELTLHIGTGKTGTSSLQRLFRDNRDRLAEHGVLFPRTPGGGRHVRLRHAVASDEELHRFVEWRRAGSPEPDAYRARIRRRLVREVRGAGLPRVLLTDEALYGATAASIDELGPWLRRFAGRIRVLVYLRRQDEHMVSRYQQVVKNGATERLESYAARNLRHVYDYAARLDLWRDRLGPDELVVRRFEPAAFVGGSLVEDFLAAARLGVAASALPPAPRVNESLDAESVEMLRILNLHRIEHHGATAGTIDNRQHLARLVEQSSGPVLSLPDADLDAFMARWQDANARVAREYLGEPDGVLFRSPRRTRSVEVVQRLDPGRLPHFLELLEIPEAEHAALRVVAEREAGAGR